MIEARELTKRFKDVLAVDRVSFEGKKGEINCMSPEALHMPTDEFREFRGHTTYLPGSSWDISIY